MSHDHAPDLDGLDPAARRALIESRFDAAAGRVRDLLAAAAREDRDAVRALATALGSDLAGLGLDDVCAAAGALAEAAAGQAPLGAPTLALVRVYEAARARLAAGAAADGSS